MASYSLGPPGRGLFVLRVLLAALSVSVPFLEGWPIGVVVALEDLAVGHGGAL
jgi:hypothetical protein